MKKRITILTIAILWICSVATAYYAGSNMGGMYPEFNAIFPYNPTYEEVGRYIDEGKAYVNACNQDIELIVEARDRAINTINNNVEMWKMNH